MSVPSVVTYSKPARCLWLLKLISEDDSLHLSELAILLKCSERSVQRDLEVLREAGVQVDSYRRGHYCLRGHYRLPLVAS